MSRVQAISFFLRADAQADKVVPPSGVSARLIVFVAAAMAFLAVFAMALSMAAGRLADRWSDELARSSTVRIVAPAQERAAQTDLVLRILETTIGVAYARALDAEEQQALLAPWFGTDLDLSLLPVPQLIEIIEEEGQNFDAEGLRLRLAAEVPTAVLDEHDAWRAPLVASANRLRLLGWISGVLLTLSMAAMVTLAANAALAANAQVISVLRLVGATDDFIARAFVRRFTLRALMGAAAGGAVGMIVLRSMPTSAQAGGFLTDLGFQGTEWFLPLIIPIVAAVVAFAATRWAAARVLGELA